MNTKNKRIDHLGRLRLAISLHRAEAGVVARMTKPLDTQHLLEILNQHLALPERAEHPPPGDPS